MNQASTFHNTLDLILQHSTELEGASEMCREWSKEIA